MPVNYVPAISVSGSEYIRNVINDYVIFVFSNSAAIKTSVKAATQNLSPVSMHSKIVKVYLVLCIC